MALSRLRADTNLLAEVHGRGQVKHAVAEDRSCLRALLRVAGCGFVVLMPAIADAHVKWFVDYNLLAPPRPALAVVSGDYFVTFCLFLGPLMFAVALVDRYLTRRECLLHRGANRISERVAPYFPLVLRAGVSAFFTAVFVFGCFGESMILTPELHTHQAWICWFQLAIAIAVLVPRTVALAAAGIVLLYAYGVIEYGLYHMLDYPIFVGVAAYLMLWTLYGERKRGLADNILRIAAGVTLLWASIEKFAFPEWSFILLAQRPGMTLGFNPELYMVAAGFIEFCAAYLLITGLLSARFAALLLLGMFVSAIVPFGTLDAVGHSVIIVVLLLLALGNNVVGMRLDAPKSVAATATLHASAFFVTLLLFVGLYYAGYYASFPHTPA